MHCPAPVSYTHLCETYTISDDGLTYTFNLRKGVKWHDGEPFTSADVEFTFQMIMDNNGVIAQELNTSVAEMSCPDENTFVMVLNAPNSVSYTHLDVYKRQMVCRFRA